MVKPFALLLVVAAPALAGDWWLTAVGGAAPNRVVRLADRASLIADTRDGVLMWEAIYQESVPVGSRGRLIEIRTRYDCRFRTGTMLLALARDDAGTVVWTQRPLGDRQEEKPVLPGTLGHISLDFACAGPKPGQRSLGAVEDLAAAGRAVLTP